MPPEIILRIGFQKRFADVRAVQRFRREAAVYAHAERIQEALQGQILPMRTIPEVEEFIRCHDGSPQHRRPILAVVGGTGLGKSLLGGSILRRTFHV